MMLKMKSQSLRTLDWRGGEPRSPFIGQAAYWLCFNRGGETADGVV